jgi:predicted amidophosphoribosyltransferase
MTQLPAKYELHSAAPRQSELEPERHDLCIRCHKRPQFERHEIRYQLCAECGLERLLEFVNCPDDERERPSEDVLLETPGIEQRQASNASRRYKPGA